MKLKMRKWDPLTGQSKVYGTQVTVKPCRHLVWYFLVGGLFFGTGWRNNSLAIKKEKTIKIYLSRVHHFVMKWRMKTKLLNVICIVHTHKELILSSKYIFYCGYLSTLYSVHKFDFCNVNVTWSDFSTACSSSCKSKNFEYRRGLMVQ